MVQSDKVKTSSFDFCLPMVALKMTGWLNLRKR